MSSRLDRYLDHCRAMTVAEHRPECPWRNPAKAERENRPHPVWHLSEDGRALVWGGMSKPIHAPCAGCVTDADREQWARMASEAERIGEQLTLEDA